MFHMCVCMTSINRELLWPHTEENALQPGDTLAGLRGFSHHLLYFGVRNDYGSNRLKAGGFKKDTGTK